MNQHTNLQSVFTKVRREHGALAILRLLHRSPGYRSNEFLLADHLSRIGLRESSVAIRASLESMEGYGLVCLEKIDKLCVAELTQRGEEVALGIVVHEGITRPGPECGY